MPVRHAVIAGTSCEKVRWDAPPECLQGSIGQRDAHKLKPAADLHRSVCLATGMPGGWTRGGGQFPVDDRELLIRALDHKTMDRILTDHTANLAS